MRIRKGDRSNVEREREIENLTFFLSYNFVYILLSSFRSPPKACAVIRLVQGEGVPFRLRGVVAINAVMAYINGDVLWQ